MADLEKLAGTEGRAFFLDASPDGGGWGKRLSFGAPRAVRRAESLEEVGGVVAWAEREARAGRWSILALAFEAAPAFDCALVAHAPQDSAPLVGFPLAWAASHDAPSPRPPFPEERRGVRRQSPWRALVSPRDYSERFARLQDDIRNGETYQTNYTVPFECAFSGDDRAWFAELARAQDAGFCAWLDMGRHRVLSLSPELFFRLEAGGADREILARPMKGTAPRGAVPEEDAALEQALARCPKNRAENVMIVDLLRSDLGRVARPGSVRVPRLFQVERYPTVFQMTSDVRATLREGTGLREILAALFPCGSVTGAPKVRTMRIIRDLEPHPRDIYCGAIGLLEPGGTHGDGRAVFSVPIRTILLDRESGSARFGVGGGVTHDSTARDEYLECQTKMRFLIPQEEEFELLESLLLQNGRYPLLAGHLARLARSADFFGFALDEAAVRLALAELARASATGRFKARLLMRRDGALRVEAAPIAGGRQAPLRVGFAPAPVASADGMLGHKTTLRAVYEAALAACPGCGDALLVNERGEVTESTRANLVLRLDGELVTPPLPCGLLPGVFRAGLLRRGVVRERVLFPQDVLRAERLWLVNSVRWWMDCAVSPCAEMGR
ncbi:MAG: aminodeoxychorismate synthase component I [Humidesulfovibrio sp.]|nr:aminodeoxychorismate synthase component I [Humidesulfovibrio sp.]